MDVTVQVSGDHELSLAEFLDGCAREASEVNSSSEVRSTLEDLEVNQEETEKTNNFINDLNAGPKQCQPQNEVPAKHGKRI